MSCGFGLLPCALTLIGCNSGFDAGGLVEPLEFEVAGVGLEGVAAPLFDSVERTTGPFLDGASLMDVYVPTGGGSEQAYPLLILLQGARVDKSFYSNYAARISAHGFVVSVGNFPGPLGFFTSTANVPTVLDHLASRVGDPSDPLHGRVDLDRIGIIGHSFGGATALTLVQGDCNFPFCSTPFEKPRALRAVGVFGAHLVEPSGRVVAVDARGVVIQFMFGALDGVANRIDVEDTFAAMTNGAKHLVELKGGNHFAINDRDNPPGTVTDTNAPQLTQDQGIAIASDWVGVFMRAHVTGNANALALLNSSNAVDTDTYAAEYTPFTIQPLPQPKAPATQFHN